MEPTTTTIGTGIAGLAGAWFAFRKFFRKDQIEGSEAAAIISINGATKSLIDEMRRNIISLGAEIKLLKDRISELVSMNQDCERRNREMSQRLLALSERVSLIQGTEMLNKDDL